MKLHEMQQKRATIAAEMRALNEKIGDASWTEEQRSQWDNAKHEYDKLDAAIKREEELRAMDNILAAENEPEHRNNPEGSEDERRAAVFDKFVRHGLTDAFSSESALIHRRLISARKARRSTRSGRGRESSKPAQRLISPLFRPAKP